MPNTQLASLAFRVGMVALVAITILSVGIFFGAQLERSHWQKRALQAAKVSSQIINTKENETQQCRAEVEKYNKANAAMQEKIAADLLQDREARKQAELEAIARDRDNRAKAQRVLIALQDIKDGIDNGKFDACTNTVADSNFIGLLNDALAANRSGDPGSDGRVPGSGAGD